MKQPDSLHPPACAGSPSTGSEALMPCPFCGGTADIDAPRGALNRGRAVYCTDCGATLGEESTVDAIAAWNRRTPLADGAPSRRVADTGRHGTDGLESAASGSEALPPLPPIMVCESINGSLYVLASDAIAQSRRYAIDAVRANRAARQEGRDAELLKSVQELTGEANTLAGILRDCDAVLATIEPDDTDEAQMLADLRLAIVYALDPYKREGGLL